MSDNTKGKIETIDKIIIFIICFIFILAILGTIWWVKYKANKELKDIISNYTFQFILCLIPLEKVINRTRITTL